MGRTSKAAAQTKLSESFDFEDEDDHDDAKKKNVKAVQKEKDGTFMRNVMNIWHFFRFFCHAFYGSLFGFRSVP